MGDARPSRPAPDRRLDAALVVTTAGLLVLSIATFVDVRRSLVAVDRGLDATITAFTLLAAIGVGLLNWTRYRADGSRTWLLQIGALGAAAGFFLVQIVAATLDLGGTLGASLGGGSDLAPWLSMADRIVVALVFLAAARAALEEDRRYVRRPWVVVIAPLGIFLLVAVVLTAFQGWLPAYTEAGPTLHVRIDGAAGSDPAIVALSGLTLLATAIGLVPVICYVVALDTFRAARQEHGSVAAAYLSVGLCLALFSELQLIAFPSVYSGIVTFADVLRLLAALVLFLGILAQERADIAALRHLAADLDRLRITGREQAALEERTRISRDLHDGLAQHLWLAKLKLDRAIRASGPATAEAARETRAALDAAIAEARSAVVTMREGENRERSFRAALREVAEAATEASGISARVAVDDAVPDRLRASAQAEVLRIIAAGLRNVVEHADATVVRIHAARPPEGIVVTVTDNGAGFDPARIGAGSGGIMTMEERAGLLGGALQVTSAPSAGTTVTLRLPTAIEITPVPAPSLPGTPQAAAPVPR